jgi:hypothetical protein
VPKLASGEWFGAYSPLNQVQDQMPIQGKQKLFCLKMEKPRLLVKKWISNAGFCSVFIVFVNVLEIKHHWFYRRKHERERNFNGRRGTQIRIRASSTSSSFL